MDESKSAPKKAPASRSAPASDPFIFLKRNAFLQRISDAVRNGYTLYVAGSTRVEKVAFKSQSMFERFNTNRSKTQEFRARAAGRTTARWLAFWEQDAELVSWVLLINPAEDIDTNEKWKDAKEERITIGSLELVRLSKPKTVLQRVETEASLGASTNKIIQVKGGKEVWTSEVRHFGAIFGGFGRTRLFRSRTYKRLSGFRVVARVAVVGVGMYWVCLIDSRHVHQAHPIGQSHLRPARGVLP
jgi:hypothetical protein